MPTTIALPIVIVLLLVIVRRVLLGLLRVPLDDLDVLWDRAIVTTIPISGIGYWDSLTSLGQNGFGPALLSRPLDQLLEGLHRGFVPEAIEGPVLSAIVPKLVPLTTVRQNAIEGNLSGVVPDPGEGGTF